MIITALRRRLTMTAAVAALAFGATGARAAEGLDVSGYLNVDLTSVIAGGSAHRLRELDKLMIMIDADFEALSGWNGARGYASFMNLSGALPNSDSGTIQGFDNIEAPGHHPRIFEAWIEQDLFGDKGSLKLGLIDLNAEFYVNSSAALLLAPTSGIGSELAATGLAGPAIFPSAALAARLSLKGGHNTYLHAAVFNALAGSPGDPGGVDTAFDGGVIEIVEGGWEADGKGKLGFGAWRYSRAQDDLFDVDAHGDPVRRDSSGAYLVAERVLADGGESGRTVTGFLRAGFSDGNTGPFKSAWHAGVLVGHVLAGRPQSQLSFGVDQATLGDSFRAGSGLGARETHLELTYSDRFFKHLAIQPDLQYVIDPGGDPRAKNALIATLRLTADF